LEQPSAALSIRMMPTVVTWLGTPSPLNKPSNVTVMTPLSLNSNPSMQNSATALGETDAGGRLAFVFTIRGGRVRFVTAYPMTPRQQEIYEQG
jgi:hypothetical protein